MNDTDGVILCKKSSLGGNESTVEIHGRKSRSPAQSPSNSVGTNSSLKRYQKCEHGIEMEQEKLSADENVSFKDNRNQINRQWITSEKGISQSIPIHDQIKQGIMGLVESELRPDSSRHTQFISSNCQFHEYDFNLKSYKHLSRPSSSHKEKRSPSHRKKKRHIKHGDKDQYADFEATASSLSALEKVDDYLKEYNNEEVITLSGDLEIEQNDKENNNESRRDTKIKSRKNKKKTKSEQSKKDNNANREDISPKVFKLITSKNSGYQHSARPKLNLGSMLEGLDSDITLSQEHHIDNPFSSPSPMTTPNDDNLESPFGNSRPDKIFVQKAGTFKAAAKDKVFRDNNRNLEDQKYFRLGDFTPLDIAITVQKAWRNAAPAFHGLLAGMSLLHLLLIINTDGLDAGHLSFHSAVTMPYVATFYFLCICCMVSVLDRLDITGLDLTQGVQTFFQPIALVLLYAISLGVNSVALPFDEMMAYQFNNLTQNISSNANITMIPAPSFYHTWSHFSIWRAVLSILGLVYLVIANPEDILLVNLGKLLQFKHSLQSIGG